jgi:hypothetical protein
MRKVGPYEYTDLVRTIRVWSKYGFGLEHINGFKSGTKDCTGAGSII